MVQPAYDGVYSERLWSPLKLLLWTILTLASLFHALARAHVRSRGWQLNRALIALCGLLVGVSAAQTATLFGHGAQQQRARVAWAVLGNLADAVFMLLLMAIASGFCMTRASLGEARVLVFAVPAVYLTASLTVDGLLLNESQPARQSAAAAALLACGVLLRLSVLATAWIFVFVSVREERAKLSARHARLRFVADAFKLEEDEEASPSRAALASQAAAQSVVDGAAASMPRAASAMNARSMAVSSAILTSAATAEGDAPDDGGLGPERAKSKLLAGFSTSVTFYVLVIAAAACFALVNASWHATMAVVQDSALWVFLSSLVWLFRPRHENPYLLLVDEYRFDDSGPQDWRQATLPPVPAQPAPRVPPPPPPYDGDATPAAKSDGGAAAQPEASPWSTQGGA